MAFDPRGTNYAAMLRQRAEADRSTTEADLRRLQRERADRVRKSGERSGLAKIGSALTRAGLSYATGGASEALGFGGAVDRVMLGEDSEGRGIRNEYGDLVQAGSNIYNYMGEKKAADIAKKRASNKEYYDDQVKLAVEMGKLNPDEGAAGLMKAEELRAAQMAQTGKADKESVWGWKNEYDPLELSSSVLKGKEVADEIPYAPSLEDGTLSQEGRETHKRAGYAPSLEEGGSVQTGRGKPRPTFSPSLEDGMTDYEGRLNRLDPNRRAELARIEAMYERDRKKAFLENENLDRQEDPLLTDSIKKRRAVDELMDGELSKKMGTTWGKGSGKTREEIVTDWLGGGQKGSGGSYAPSSVTNRIQDDIKPSDIGKTFSKKEAEKLSEKDSDKAKTGTLDDIAFDTEGERLKERYSGFSGIPLKTWDKMSEPEKVQLYNEYRLKEERALKKQLESQPSPFGRADYEGSIYRPWESALKKRLRKKRALERAKIKERGGLLSV